MASFQSESVHAPASAMTSTRGDIKHLDYIDAVRGLAFLWVLTFHCALCVGQFPLRWLFLHGVFGVELFFLASAITLNASWMQRREVDRFPALAFYVRRFLRIAPMFWLGMVFYTLLPDVMPHFWLGQFAPNGVRPVYFLATASFVNGWYPYSFSSIVPGGWSIAVEMTFYLFCPLCFTLLGTPRRAAAATVLCLWLSHYFYDAVPQFLRSHLFPGVQVDGAFLHWGHFWFPTQAPVFMLGFCIYHLLSNPQVRRLVRDRFLAWTILVACILALWGFLPGQTHFTPVDFWVVAALAGVVVSISGGAVPILVMRPLRYVGILSYSCYLVHFAALGLALRLFHIRLSADEPGRDFGSPVLNFTYFAALCGLTLAATVVVAALTSRRVERPGIELGRRIVRRLNRKFPQSSGAVHER